MTTPSDVPPPVQAAKKALSERMFIRLLGLVRSRLFAQIRSDKDVLVVDSVLSSFFQHHTEEEIDLEHEDSFWPILSKIALRHCSKHNKRAQRALQPRSVPIGSSSADDSAAGFEPVDDEPPPEAQVEFVEFLGRLEKQLSARERKVLALALAQESQGDIAEQLKVSQTTISNDMNHIRAKLKAELQRLS